MNRVLYLCGGLQSSGSTLVSWCFLQRRDMDGHLDHESDVVAELPKPADSPRLWYKTTISAFRMSELIGHYQDEGWEVRPLLICRDVRTVWASLAQKPYGINGTTAEDPPLRLRLRRFRADYELFRNENWPLLSFEQFQTEPVNVLRRACEQMQLPWDNAMLTWPKPRTAIMSTRHGNETFRHSVSQGLLSSLRPRQSTQQALAIPEADFTWLEEEFAEYNRALGYPANLERSRGSIVRAVPTFDKTRRQKWLMQQAPLRYLLFKLGLREPTAAVR